MALFVRLSVEVSGYTFGHNVIKQMGQRMDLRVVPILCIVLCIVFLDQDVVTYELSNRQNDKLTFTKSRNPVVAHRPSEIVSSVCTSNPAYMSIST